MKILARIVSVFAIVCAIGGATVFALSNIATPLVAPAPFLSYGSGNFFLPPYESDADRMGFGKSSNDDASILNAGWYLDWGANPNPPHPGGAEYGRTIYLNVSGTGTYCTWYKNPATQANQITASITGTTLVQRVQAAPGALWMVGNEPDSIYNGSPIQAELYAELYHYFYTTIKTADPTAKVAIGAIVQPSPLRMEYLDKVLTHYQNTYSETMPIDVWNIHFYRLNEGDCSTWGANVPPFASSSTGWNVNFSAAELLSVSFLESALHDFRQWMADRGYRNQPLIVTEFGVLPPPTYNGFDNNTAAQFLTDMFNMMLAATDPNTGLSTDGNRLVQMWAWYSTQDSFHSYGGNLFNSDGTLSPIGEAFIAFTPFVDMQFVPSAGVFTATTTGLTVSALVQNYGNYTATNVVATATLYSPLSHAALSSHTESFGALARRNKETPQLFSYAFDLSAIGEPLTNTVPYTVQLTTTAAESDTVPATNQTTFLVQFVRNVTVSLTQSASNITFSPGNVGEYVVTATVKNIGQLPSITTTAAISLTDINGSRVSLPVQATIDALIPNETQAFTAAFSITETGQYTATAQILQPAGDGELVADNSASMQVSALKVAANIYLPLVLK